MKIFFSYLFLRLLQVFAIILICSAALWLLVDIYGTMEDFFEHKFHMGLFAYFYILQVPLMLVQVLPASLLFATLFTFLMLNRRCELVALQSSGMAPIWIFSPFIIFGVLCTIILAYDLSGPAATSEVTRERLLREVKGQGDHGNVITNFPYVDTVNHRIWFFQSLDPASGTAYGLEITEQDAEFHDITHYVAGGAHWTPGGFWRLDSGVQKTTYGVGGNLQEQKVYSQIDLPDVTTPPKQLSLISSQPEELTLQQLGQYIESSTQTEATLAKYRTEWWYRVLYPLSMMVLMIFGLLQGTRNDRHGAVAGIFWAIVVLIVYVASNYVLLGFGKGGRMPPMLAAGIAPFVFGLIGLHLLAINNGWYIQIVDLYRKWQAQSAEDDKAEAEAAA